MCAANERKDVVRSGVSGLFEDLLTQGNSVRVQATGRSMKPFLKGDEFLVIEPMGCRRVEKGDLVLFKNAQNVLVIHRVIRQTGKTVQTQGDALNEPDLPVDLARVLGWVKRIEKGPMSLNLVSRVQRLGARILADRLLRRGKIRRFGALLKARLKKT